MSGEPMYVEVAKLKLALGDLWVDVGDELVPILRPFFRSYCYRKALRLYNEGYAAIREWEAIKREVS